jgi:hypothetical protein
MKDNSATTGILGTALATLSSGTGTVTISIRPVNGVVNPNYQAGNLTTTGSVSTGALNATGATTLVI